MGIVLSVITLLGPVSLAAQELPGAASIPWSYAPHKEPVEAAPRDDANARPMHLPGTVYVGIADVDPGGDEAAQVGIGVHVQGNVAERTRLTLSIVRGRADLLSLLALMSRQGTTVQVELLNPQWRVVAGDFVAPAHALSAAAVRADGLSVKYAGPLLVEFLAGRPKYLEGGGGHFAHVSLGVRHRWLTLRLLGTMLARRPPAHVRVRVAPDPAVESERDIDDLSHLVQLVPRDATLQAAGGELTLKTDHHESVLRLGALDAHGALGDHVRGSTGEWRYSMTYPAATLTAYGRRSPGGLTETHLGGDAASLIGTVRLPGRWKLVGRGLWSSAPVPRLTRAVRTSSASAGVQYARNRARLTVQAKYNSLRAPGLVRDTETLHLNVALPSRWVTADVDLDAGRALQNSERRPYHALRGRLAFVPDAPVSGGVSAAYDDIGGGTIRRRFDADMSASWGNWLLEGGAGWSSGQLLGNMRHFWASVEAPLPRGVSLLVSAEHVRWDVASSRYLSLSEPIDFGSPWRVTLGVRRSVTVPFPLLRSRRESRGPTP